MAVPEPVIRVVSAARGRLGRARLIRRLVGWAGGAAAGAAGVAGVARHWVIEWADLAAVAIPTGGAVAAVAWSLLRRPGVREAAIAVDRRLGGYDRVTTALELGSKEGLARSERDQLVAASAWAEGREVGAVTGLLPDTRAMALAALSVVVLTVLVLVPAPTDLALAQREAERAAIQEEADHLEALAGELPEGVADRLVESVEELRRAPDLESALEALGDARQELTESLDPAALARRTGLAGLETSFRQSPLAEGDSAAQQLREAARHISSGDMSGLERAVEQLRRGAADAAGVDPELAEALDRAADELTQMAAGTGAPGEAGAALREAAEAMEEAHAESAAQQAAAETANQLAEAQQRLAGGSGEGGEAEGGGEGRGQGEGQGPGRGEGGGRGRGPGGSGGGDGAGGQQGAGPGTGQGGSGMGSGGGGDDDPAIAPERSTVFDPAGDALGERERVDLPSSDEQGEVRGRTDGRGGAQNLALTPYTDRIGDYRETALQSLDRLTVPASVREVVRDYFIRLEPGGGQ